MQYILLLFFMIGFSIPESNAQALFEMKSETKSRLSSFENPNGMPGNGGQTNRKAKGNAFEWIEPGTKKTLLNINGEGHIQRIWLTIDQNPQKLRTLRFQCYWEGDTKPAVDVPLGDFFGYNLAKPVRFESAMLSTGEGRSFNAYFPMPFRKQALIQIVNEGNERVKLFFDIAYALGKIPATSLYFHALWQRHNKIEIGEDLLVLPEVEGKGKFLGMTVGLITDSIYGRSWWGEGEVKVFLDDDSEFPTINGTGAEDYIGSAWGLGEFTNQYQGCTMANDSLGQFSFYRWHIPDPIFFHKKIKVTLQQIGGWMRDDVRKLVQRGARLKPITVDQPEKFWRLLDMENPPHLMDKDFPDGWVNFYRSDDYAAVSYFYLNKTSKN